MPLNLARRGGATLRNLHLSDAFSRPIRVAVSQSHIRRISLITRGKTLRPISRALPSTSVLSQRLLKTYTTTSDSKSEKKTPTKTTKGGTGTKKTKKTKKSSTKPKPKPKPRKQLTEEQKEAKKEAKKARELKDHIKALKVTALEVPKKLPDRVANLIIVQKLQETLKTHKSPQEAFKAASELGKTISEEERERITAIAESNRNANETAYEQWIKSHTPLQIKEANLARSRLTRLTKKKYPLLRDDRLVKRPSSSYVFFYLERTGQGDFKHMAVKDIGVRVAEEWKGLTESEKEVHLPRPSEDDTPTWMRLIWTRNITSFKSPTENVMTASIKRYTARSRLSFESPPSKSL
ncbi:HMG box protein [Aspergillus bombycis]|uniref:HMG box protein n=1 Tax=Aspergillus bombycis TaxID=109264 RepID=A0A1F7ZYC8_9EURO|nr:HMG box protein [Aspergillus bombycis]OGM44068.1 HMG box protein [Aspergillus bombycis]